MRTLAAALLLAMPAQAQEVRFGDWTASCGGDACLASTRSDLGATLTLSRMPARAEHWSIAFEGVAAASYASLMLDGAAIGPGVEELWNFGGSLEPADEALLATLIPRIRNGVVLRMDPDSEGIHSFSLVGMSAALLWVEEQTGTVGQPRIADRTEGVPRANAPEVVERPMPPKIAAMRKAIGCTSAEPATVETWSAEGGTYWHLTCDRRTSISYSVLLLEDFDGLFPVSAIFPTRDGNLTHHATRHLLPFLQFDPNTLRLTAMIHDRPECGATYVWRLHHGGTQLIEAREDVCEDDAPDVVEVLPVIYRLGVTP